MKDLSMYVMRESWKVPFLRRKRIPEECDLFDDVNGVYPNDDDWEATSTLNLRAKVDENGRVSKIDYYKVRDLGGGHGRPQTRDLELNASDLKKFRGILEAATISRADSVLEPLLQRAMDEGLPGNWRLLKSNKSSVVFENPEGERVSVPRKRILNALEISYSFIDVLDSKDFWDANDHVLNLADRDALLALFSLVDTSDYYDRETLISEAEARAARCKEEYERAVGIKLLYEACEREDLKTVRKYAAFASEGAAGDEISPLRLAIRKGNLEIVNLLLNHGASVNEHFWSDGGFKSPLYEAIISGRDDIVFRCAKEELQPDMQEAAMLAAVERKRADYVIALLKKGVGLDAGKVKLRFSVEDLAQFAKYPGIKWLPKQLEAAYKAGDIKTVKNMLKSLAAFSDQPPRSYYGGYLEESIPYQKSAVEWLVKKKDLSLMRYCAGLQYKIASDYADIWETLLSLPNSWAKYVQAIFANPDYYECNVQSALDHAAESLSIQDCKKLMTGYGAKIDSVTVYSVCRYSRDRRDFNSDRYERMLRFLMDHYAFPNERYDRAGQERRESNGPYTRRNQSQSSFEFFFEGIIESCSRDLCLYLFDRYPEILDYPGLQSSLMYYCYRRTVDDDVRQVAEDRICPLLYSRALHWVETNEATGNFHEQLKSTVRILMRAGKADTDDFAAILHHLRSFEEDKSTWANCINAIASGLEDQDVPIPAELWSFQNESVAKEWAHIYSRANKLCDKSEDFLVRIHSKKLVEYFEANNLPALLL